jgi:arabinogalactan endo-1,4-beta-galactosidase
MLDEGKTWSINGIKVDPLKAFAERGVKWIRIRIFTKKGTNGFTYAVRTALRAQQEGITPYINFFLSDCWATAIEQPVPKEWKKLSIKERAEAIRKYCFYTVTSLKQSGVRTSLYQIGNEIDYGMCGVHTDDIRRENVKWMSKTIWPYEAELIKGAIKGIKQADSKAQFIIHIAHWFNKKFGIGFFRFMKKAGVNFDYLGASYYPSSNIPMHHFNIPNTFTDLNVYVSSLTKAIKKPLIFCEYGYPSEKVFNGAFQHWNHPVRNYPLTTLGQREWLYDFLNYCIQHPMIAGAFYWSPEYYCHEDWVAFSFFDSYGVSKPVIEVFQELKSYCLITRKCKGFSLKKLYRKLFTFLNCL